MDEGEAELVGEAEAEGKVGGLGGVPGDGGGGVGGFVRGRESGGEEVGSGAAGCGVDEDAGEGADVVGGAGSLVGGEGWG